MKKLLYILILCCFISCEQKHFFNKYESVDAKNWKQTDTLNYLIDIVDSNAVYDISVSIRYQKEYEFSNLWLTVYNSNELSSKPIRLEVPLFKNDGKPYGKSSGSLCTQTVSLQKQVRFPKNGKYTINIAQLMRKEPLNGISDVGVIIDKEIEKK